MFGHFTILCMKWLTLSWRRSLHGGLRRSLTLSWRRSQNSTFENLGNLLISGLRRHRNCFLLYKPAIHCNDVRTKNLLIVSRRWQVDKVKTDCLINSKVSIWNTLPILNWRNFYIFKMIRAPAYNYQIKIVNTRNRCSSHHEHWTL